MSEVTHDSESTSRAGFPWIWLGILTIPVALRFALSVIDSYWWGLNYLAFAPTYYVIILSTLFAAALGFIIFRSQQSQDTARIEQVCNFLVSNRGAALAAFVGAGIFWLLSSDSHLFASGYERIGNLAQRTTPFVHEYEYLAAHLGAQLYRLTSGINERAIVDAALVIRITSVLSGAGCIWLWLSIIARLGKNHRERAALFAFLFFGGATTLFFGVGELQAPAVFYVSLLIWLTVALLQSRGKTARAKYAMILALCAAPGPFYLAHLIFFIPPMIYIIGTGLFPGGWRERVWGTLYVAAIVALVFYLYQLGSENLWVQARLALQGGKPPEFDYSLFSVSRMFDLANSAFFLWPLAPAALGICLRYSYTERADHLVNCLGALTISAGLWIFIADFPGGAAREVTTLAPFSIPALVLAGYLWNKRVTMGLGQGKKLTGVLFVASVVSFLSIAPVTNSAEGSTLYLDHDYQRRSERYLGGLISFRDHYFFLEDYATADRWEQSFKAKSSVYLDHESILGMVRAGEYIASLRRLEFLLATHPHWAPLRGTQAGVYLALGRLTEAHASILKARELSPESHYFLISDGDIWQALGAPDSARTRYELAYQRVNNDPNALQRMAVRAYSERKYEQAKRYAYLLFESDFSNVYSYLMIGLVAYEEGEIERARMYLSYMQRVAPNIAEAALVNDLLAKLNSSGG